MNKVHVEILSWPAEIFNFQGNSDTIRLEQEIEEGKTVRDLLNGLAARYQPFGQVVFDVNSQKLTEKVNVYFNGGNLELADGLATRLRDGDTLTLVAPIIGG